MEGARPAFYGRFFVGSNPVTAGLTFDTFGMFLLSSPGCRPPASKEAESQMRKPMRIALGILAAVLLTTGSALAAQVEGLIKSINKDEQTITLDDGKSYKLPGEFDVESLKEGMDVMLAYDEIGGVAQITDMDLSE